MKGSNPDSMVVNGFKLSKGDKVAFGHKWKRTGTIQVFSLYGGALPSALVMADDGSGLAWRATIKPSKG